MNTFTTWPEQAMRALRNAQAKSEAIRAIARVAQGETRADMSSLFEAVCACTESIDDLVDPLIDAGVPADGGAQ